MKKIKRIIILGLMLTLFGLLFSPAQVAEAQPGTPAFQITDWSINPETLERGGEFDLTITFTNIGSYGAGSVIVSIASTGTFVGLTPSQSINRVEIGDVHTVTMRGGISSSLTSGYYNLPVQFSFHNSDYGGQRMVNQTDIGVYIEGLDPDPPEPSTPTPPDNGRPQLVITDSTVDVREADKEIDLTLVVNNIGNRWATDVVVNLGQSEFLSPATGSTATVYAEDIYVNQPVEITIPFGLVANPRDTFLQGFTLEYASYNGGSYQAQESVPVTVQGFADETPRLIITTVETDPVNITPGSEFDLNLTVENVGDGDADRVFVRLGQDASSLGPLAPVGSTNVSFLDQVDADDSMDVTMRLAVDGTADAGLIPLDIDLEYEDGFDTTITETVTISLRVIDTPFLEIGLFEPIDGPVFVGDVIDLPVEVINIGRGLVNVSTVTVTSDDFDISDGSLYIGALDGGTSGSLIAIAEALEEGSGEITVTVNYLDSFQQQQEITSTITVDVEDNDSPAANDTDEDADDGDEEELGFFQRLWRGIRSFFGFGGGD